MGSTFSRDSKNGEAPQAAENSLREDKEITQKRSREDAGIADETSAEGSGTLNSAVATKRSKVGASISSGEDETELKQNINISEPESISADCNNVNANAKDTADQSQHDRPGKKQKKKKTALKPEAGSSKQSKKKKSKKKLNLSYLSQEGDASREWPERLLIFDINNVLVARSKKPVQGLAENFRDPLGFRVFDRPHMRELLHWAVHERGYKVALWTSATAPVAQAIAKHIFAAPKFNLEEDCLFVFDQSACGRKGRTSQNTPNFTKPLVRVWHDPDFSNKFSAENTLILDNDLAKFAMDEANALHISVFDPTIDNETDEPAGDGIDVDFGEKGALWRFLDALARCDGGDVRAFVQDQPLSSFRS
mmetsp:Transcript_7020/g.14073  ORF Transcript_7020/g.14073 Transcript_7020/m.14073 type:complete len:365 (+) Transcript_7020:217-1311(+)